MPVTRTNGQQPVDQVMIQSSRRQHAGAADNAAKRAGACAHAVRVDLAHARPAQAAARQLLAEAIALLEALGALREVERLAAWTRQPAA